MKVNSAEELIEKVKELYENTIQKGETFSPEIEEKIREEMLRIIREREEWEKFKKWCQK